MMVGVHGPQDHRIGHEFNLGQKPKLGGRYADNHSYLHIIFCRSIIYPCFVFFLYFAVPILFLLSKTQKKTKNISVVSLWLSLWFFVFGLLNLLVSLLFENPKIFYFLCFCSCLSKIENPKIFCVLLWFCKVCCRVQWSMAAPLEFGYHIILFKPQEKSNNDDLHSLICDERLV